MKTISKVLVGNLNAAIFLVGFGALCAGLWSFAGGPVASMVGGGILMLVAAWPYLRPRKGLVS